MKIKMTRSGNSGTSDRSFEGEKLLSHVHGVRALWDATALLLLIRSLTLRLLTVAFPAAPALLCLPTADLPCSLVPLSGPADMCLQPLEFLNSKNSMISDFSF